MSGAIVTGASSGIGAAVAVKLAGRGYDLGLTYRGAEDGALRTKEAVEAEGRRCFLARLDLSDPVSVSGVIDGLADELGGIEILVNNAGADRRRTMSEESVEGWNATLAVNLVGPWACARTAAKHMRQGRGGRIVNVTSILSSVPLEGGGAYCAAKAGLELATQVMALEWAQDGIRVNAVAPGHTATPMNFPAEDLDGSPIKRPVIPLRHAASAAEVAQAVVFLATEDSSYVTGSSLLVDGGLRLASGPQSLQEATGLPPEKEDL
jgi:hypothetical protein